MDLNEVKEIEVLKNFGFGSSDIGSQYRHCSTKNDDIINNETIIITSKIHISSIIDYEKLTQ